MKSNPFTRTFLFFIIAQFLNVQIQTAYGTEAITQTNPDVVAALKRAEEKIKTRLQPLSEEEQIRYAYRLYKIDVRLRNKTYRKSNYDIQSRIQNHIENLNRPNQEQNKETEDRDLEQNLNTDAGLQVLASELSQASPLQVTSQAALSQEVATHRSIFTRENLLKNTDPLLTKLGSKVKANGQFSIASYKNFQSKLFELNEATEGRNPAALNIIVKIILALLVIAAGIAILYFVLLIFALGSIFGGPSTSGAIILYLIAGGAITGMIFGLRAIINSKIDTRKRTAVPVLC